MQQTVDACGYVYSADRYARERILSARKHILREASALFARSTTMGNAKASERGTGNKYGLTFLFFINQSNANAETRRLL